MDWFNFKTIIQKDNEYFDSSFIKKLEHNDYQKE